MIIENAKTIPDARREKKVHIKSKDVKPKFSFKEAKEFEEIEGVIFSLEEKLELIEEEMISNSSCYGKLQDLMKEKDKIEEDLMFRYERFEYLQNIQKEIEKYKSSNI